MARVIITPKREEISDPHTLVAQKYAGYFIGHNYRHTQQMTNSIANGWIKVDKKPWKEPVVTSDDCIFCQRMTDEQVIDRVAGYQHQIDIEVLRHKGKHFNAWLTECSSEVPEVVTTTHSDGTIHHVGQLNSMVNRRRFCELYQDKPTQFRPDGWKEKPLPMVDLPLRLKRKLCIEWNHIYRDYLSNHPGVYYDFEIHEFCEQREPPEPCEDCHGKGILTLQGAQSWIHTAGCPTTLKRREMYGGRIPDTVQARAMWAMYFGHVPPEDFFDAVDEIENGPIPCPHGVTGPCEDCETAALNAMGFI